MVARELGKEVIFLAHPRTRKRLQEFGLLKEMKRLPGLRMEEPVGYLDFLNLISHAALILTDSGGVQQESCIFQVPCITLRDNTEWVETLEVGANRLVGVDPMKIVEGAHKMSQAKGPWANPFGDGASAMRIVDVIEKEALGKPS